jgi:CDGSH-type Zn-finger protein
MRPARRSSPSSTPPIDLVEDPANEGPGPLWVRGGVQVVAADGFEYELRNRVTLCRCGASRNKPFCDGTHAAIKFKDDLGSRRSRFALAAPLEHGGQFEDQRFQFGRTEWFGDCPDIGTQSKLLRIQTVA